MPRSNRPKKPQSQTTKSHTRTSSKSTITYTKRQEILDDDGWTHVVDTPRRRQRASTVSKSVNGGMHTGDFEIDGVGFVNRTLEEMQMEVEFWRKGWEGESARRNLESVLLGREDEGAGEKRVGEDDIVVEEKTETVAPEDQREPVKEHVVSTTDDATLSQVDNMTVPQQDQHETAKESVVPAADDPTLPRIDNVSLGTAEQDQSAEVKQETTQEVSASTRCKVDNIIVLGLGSLQSARREGRRATLTQLAALETIIKHFETETSESLPVVLQEPQFTPLDIEYLQSRTNFQVVRDPEAFSKITKSSLVYAVHCYSQVYRAISEGTKPAVLIGTDMNNFGKFNMSEDGDATQNQLESLIEGCEEIGFPQVRHDFSDTKIYWRKTQS